MPRHLPTLGTAVEHESPRVDVARRRLGGRASSEPGAGTVVELTQDGNATAAVVLFVSGDELDVWTGQGHVQRLGRDRVRPLPRAASRHLQALAGEVSVFMRLHEGARVRYVDGSGNVAEGTLVEKCRYGALVLRDDQHIMAVGFRKLFPAGPASVRC
jgi:hypothetical protein